MKGCEVKFNNLIDDETGKKDSLDLQDFLSIEMPNLLSAGIFLWFCHSIYQKWQEKTFRLDERQWRGLAVCH